MHIWNLTEALVPIWIETIRLLLGFYRFDTPSCWHFRDLGLLLRDNTLFLSSFQIVSWWWSCSHYFLHSVSSLSLSESLLDPFLNRNLNHLRYLNIIRPNPFVLPLLNLRPRQGRNRIIPIRAGRIPLRVLTPLTDQLRVFPGYFFFNSRLFLLHLLLHFNLF